MNKLEQKHLELITSKTGNDSETKSKEVIMELTEGKMVIVTTGTLKGAHGKIKRVDQKKRTVCVEFDEGLITNTYKTHTMSCDNVVLNQDYYAWKKKLDKREW